MTLRVTKPGHLLPATATVERLWLGWLVRCSRCGDETLGATLGEALALNERRAHAGGCVATWDGPDGGREWERYCQRQVDKGSTDPFVKLGARAHGRRYRAQRKAQAAA